MSNLEGQISIFDVLAYETKDNKFQKVERHIEVKEKDMRVICECLKIAKDYLEESTPASSSGAMMIKNKLKQIDKVMDLVQVGAGYNFYKQLDKCNKEYKDDVGEDAMIISASKPRKEV